MYSLIISPCKTSMLGKLNNPCYKSGCASITYKNFYKCSCYRALVCTHLANLSEIALDVLYNCSLMQNFNLGFVLITKTGTLKLLRKTFTKINTLANVIVRRLLNPTRHKFIMLYIYIIDQPGFFARKLSDSVASSVVP